MRYLHLVLFIISLMNLFETTAQDTTYFDGYYVVELSIDEVISFENLDGISFWGEDALPDDSYRVFRVYLEVPDDYTQLSSFYHEGVVDTPEWTCSCPNIFCTDGDMYQTSWDYGWMCGSSFLCGDETWFTDTWLSVNGSEGLAFNSAVGWSVPDGNYEINESGGALFSLDPLDVSEFDNLWIGNLVCNEEFTFCLGAHFFHTEEGGMNNIHRQVFFTAGCMETSACNFNPNATINAFCEFPEILDCANNCVNDYDGDGVCDEFEIVGCIYPSACNYDVNATDPSGECVFPFTNCQTCSGEIDGTGVVQLNDEDEDGVCDSEEILGCTDPEACNYESNATEDYGCLYSDTDGDGVCDENEIDGCSVTFACNYSPSATDDDGSCEFPLPGYGCNGESYCLGMNEIVASSNVLALGDSVVLSIPAALDSVVYSFELNTTIGNQHTIPHLSPFNNFLLRVSGTYTHVTSNWSGTVDAAFYPGGQAASHWKFQNSYIRPHPDLYNPEHRYNYFVDWDEPKTVEFTGANNSNAGSYGSLTFDVVSTDSMIVAWSNGGIGGELVLWPEESIEISAIIQHGGVQCMASTLVEVGTVGCQAVDACNYDASALIHEESLCIYPEEHYDCQGLCLCDADNDGVCDDLEIIGCSDQASCTYSPAVTEHNIDYCSYPDSGYDCDGGCLNDEDGDGVCDEFEVLGCSDSTACNYLDSATDHVQSICEYAEEFYDCLGMCVFDEDNDGVCDQLEEAECENLAIDSIWTNLESGVYPTVNEIQLGIETELSFAFSLAAISTDLESGQSFSNISFEVDSIENRPNWLSCDVAGLIINPEEPVCLGCAALALDTGVFDLSLSGNLTVSVLGSPFELGEYSFPFQIIVQENNDPILGCDYTMALNYLPVATVGDGSCIFEGCMDPLASNFNALANTEGDCEYFVSDSCPKDLDGDGLVGVSDLLSLLSDYGAVCE